MADTGNQFFFCRVCRTHIAKATDYSTHWQGWERADPIFVNVVNMYAIINPMVIQQIRGRDVVHVRCNTCENVLGKQYLADSIDDGIVRNCILDMRTLMKWDGEKIVDGSETGEYSILGKKYPKDLTIEPWFADSAAGRVGLELYLNVNRFDPKVNQFFVCRVCLVNIAKIEDFHTHYQGWELAEPVFRNIINVYTANPPVQQLIRGCVVLDVKCNKCGNLLGNQLLEPPRGDVTRICYIPDPKRFMIWDGYKFVDEADI